MTDRDPESPSGADGDSYAGERTAIDRVDEPGTVESIRADLAALGVVAGDTLLVHSSLSALGYVAGGAPAVVDALRAAVGEGGTLVVPTFTGQYGDPAGWQAPPVPDDWVEPIRRARPAFRPALTPSRGMGAIPEALRTYPDAVRSRHPEVSFAALGADADRLVADHPFDFQLGEGSPLGRLSEADARVLLLGVGHGVNTSFHLAEYRVGVGAGTVAKAAPIRRDGDRIVVEYRDRPVTAEDFPALGSAFEEAVGLRDGPVGGATAKLASQPALVEFAEGWLERNRDVTDTSA
jgi:aminoglycoside 3-N-acetyltransferase